jgi:hypothetical protein
MAGIKDIPPDVQFPKCCPGKKALYAASRGKWRLAQRYGRMAVRGWVGL